MRASASNLPDDLAALARYDARRARFEAALSRVPDVEPDERDRLPE